MYLTISEAQQQLPALSQQLHQEPAIITQDGKPVMVALSIDQVESLLETSEILADDDFLKALQVGIKQADTGELVSLESVKAELGLSSISP